MNIHSFFGLVAMASIFFNKVYAQPQIDNSEYKYAMRRGEIFNGKYFITLSEYIQNLETVAEFKLNPSQIKWVEMDFQITDKNGNGLLDVQEVIDEKLNNYDHLKMANKGSSLVLVFTRLWRSMCPRFPKNEKLPPKYDNNGNRLLDVLEEIPRVVPCWNRGCHKYNEDELFTCPNGSKIQKKYVCDGHQDCRDNSDELNCPTHGLRTPREEIAFTARPKIHSHSQIFRYGGSIFCLPHRPNFSDIFDLSLHWVSVVRGCNTSNGGQTNFRLESYQYV